LNPTGSRVQRRGSRRFARCGHQEVIWADSIISHFENWRFFDNFFLAGQKASSAFIWQSDLFAQANKYTTPNYKINISQI
jgi:hypothetical protein